MVFGEVMQPRVGSCPVMALLIPEAGSGGGVGDEVGGVRAKENCDGRLAIAVEY